MIIRLPCSPDADLNWKPLLPNGSEPIFWEFDLGINAPYFPIEDELYFHALKLALSLFAKDVWPAFQHRTQGAILYRGSADFSRNFTWSEKQEANWNLWEKVEAPLPHLRKVFCANAFAYYFQTLSHALPDELPVYLLFDGAGCGTAAETLHLLSLERYEHFLVAVKGVRGWDGLKWEGEHIVPPKWSSPHAICFPEEARCGGSLLAKLDQLFEQLADPIRVIPEAFLTERWEGVDVLYVFSEGMTVQGNRKLLGFCAAGGEVIVDKKFGAEGFEPPAYWSQTSRASQTALCPEIEVHQDTILHDSLPR